MQSPVKALQTVLTAKWDRIEAEEARHDDDDWFSDLVAVMFEIDQRYRDLYVELIDAGETSEIENLKRLIRDADQRHQRTLSGWLSGREWPRLSRFGAVTCEHAWMIALHADNDVAFQEDVLEQMTPLLPLGEVAAVHYAALFDRAALSRGDPQYFGMFYRVEDGKEIPYPIDNPNGLEARRRELGLGDKRYRR